MAVIGDEPAKQLDLFVAVLTQVSIKGDMASLEHPIFALKPTKSIRTYALGKDCEIKVIPSSAGCPTMDDKDILVYLASQIRAGFNSGLKVAPTIQVSAYDMLRSIGRSIGGADYRRLTVALTRLRGATIETRIKTGGVRQEQGFGLIDSWSMTTRDRFGSPRLRIRVSDWYFRAVEANEVLTVDEDYFALNGLSKRLYELVRKHLGSYQVVFKIDLEKLRHKSGSLNSPRRFKFEVRKIIDVAQENRISGQTDPWRDWLLSLNGSLFVAYRNDDSGRQLRAKDALKSLRS